MRRFLPATAFLVALLLSGCGLLGGGGSSNSGGSAILIVANQTSQPVYYLYASRCSESNWGADQLDEDEVIMPGTRKSFTMGTGCWDLKATMKDGNDVLQRNAQISASAWTWTIG